MPSSTPRVVLAEDDEIILACLTSRLRAEGFRTSAARDGPYAVQLCTNLSPDVLLLDIGLPEKDGFGVLEELRRRNALAGTRVLMITGRHGVAEVRRAIQLGADDFLAKPFDEDLLVMRMRKLLAPQRAARETVWVD